MCFVPFIITLNFTSDCIFVSCSHQIIQIIKRISYKFNEIGRIERTNWIVLFWAGRCVCLFSFILPQHASNEHVFVTKFANESRQTVVYVRAKCIFNYVRIWIHGCVFNPFIAVFSIKTILLPYHEIKLTYYTIKTQQ